MPTAVPGLVSSSSAAAVGIAETPTTRGHRSELGKPKIENFRVAALRDEEIRGFDVSVDDALCVSCVEPVRYLDAQVKDVLHFHRATTDAVFQRRTVQILHDYENLAALLADLVNRCRCSGDLTLMMPALPCEIVPVPDGPAQHRPAGT